LTKEALVRAFNDDGIMDLEGVAKLMLKMLKKDSEIQKTEPYPVDFALLGKRTPPDIARSITHRTPKVPFLLDGVAYNPKDISRFDGQALLFTPIVAADGSDWIQLFKDEIGPLLANYFQMRQIDRLLNPADFSSPDFPPQNPPGTPPQTSGPTGGKSKCSTMLTMRETGSGWRQDICGRI
jgi:hypothetical protein